MRKLAILAGALALGALPALAQTVPETRILRVVPNADLQTLDPVNTTAGVVQSHAHMIYDQLFGRDAQQRPQPQMVERFETSADGLTWRFTLREGLAFHDGAPVTAEDVVASLRRWAARDPHGRQIAAITEALSAEAPSSSTGPAGSRARALCTAATRPIARAPSPPPAPPAASACMSIGWSG